MATLDIVGFWGRIVMQAELSVFTDTNLHIVKIFCNKFNLTLYLMKLDILNNSIFLSCSMFAFSIQVQLFKQGV